VYRLQGLDLRAMKIVTVFTFVIFLVAFASWVRPLLAPVLFPVSILLVGLSPAFWTYRDLIASEFPYLMFSFLGLAAIRRAGRDLRAQEWRPEWALVVAILLYATYGTRTIGIALAAAFALADVVRFKRPSRFLILVLGLLAIFIVAQSAFVSSPKGYLSVAHVSLASVSGNLWSYTKSLSYVWKNGFSQAARVLLAVILTTPAAIAFCRRFSRERSTDQFYLLAYLAILIAWGAQIGIRGLLPILPVYFAYALLGVSEALRGVRQHSMRLAFAGSLAIGVGVTYAGALHQPPWQASQANVLDPSAREMFAFLREQTSPSDLLVFSKPRSIALFTGRRTASLGPEENSEDSAEFLRRSGPAILIQSKWTPSSWSRFIANHRGDLTEEFHNQEFRIFRIRFAESNQRSRARRPD
jgi:hypothetical protein